MATSLVVVLTPLSSVLALSEEKHTHMKIKFFPFPSVEQLNLPELPLPKAAPSLRPALVRFPFLDINLWTICF